jgi:rod shape-determining protein MreB
MLALLSDLFACDLAIDLGSSNTLIYRKGRWIEVNEPTLVAFRLDSGTRFPVGFGTGAKELLDRGVHDVSVIRPVQHGAIRDREAGRDMIADYLQRVRQRWWDPPLRVIANAPVLASDEERRAIKDVIRAAGAREVYLLEQPRALAAGAGLELFGRTCAMIVDIGGAITEIAIISEGRVMQARCIPLGGEDMDQAIAEHVRERHRLCISRQSAERIKIQIGNAWPGPEGQAVSVSGHHISADIPGAVPVTEREVREALEGTLTALLSALRGFLEDLSPEQAVAILDNGIALGGGGSLIRGLDRLIERELLYPVYRVQDPLTCVVRGSGCALHYLEHFRRAAW